MFSLLAFSMGAWAFIKTQEVSKEVMEPFVVGCTTAAEGIDLIPHEPLLGGTFVCIITQFLHRLTQNTPAGLITWVSTIAASFPVSVLMLAEGGRAGAGGIIRYPTLIGLMMQFLGVSVIFPLVWVPGYLLLSSSRTGPVLSRRIYIGLVITLLPATLLTFFTFTLTPASYPWTLCAGILGGPILPLSSLLLWGMEPTKVTDASAVVAGARATANAYLFASICGFLAWMVVVHAALDTYELDPFALWDAVWTNADGSVRFMTIDAGILFLALIVYIASKDLTDALAALLVSPILGPGASCGLILWMNECVRAKTAAKAEKIKTN
jgi:hypothetical protein